MRDFGLSPPRQTLPRFDSSSDARSDTENIRNSKMTGRRLEDQKTRRVDRYCHDRDRYLRPQAQQHIQFDTFIVQPGVVREGRAERLSNMLAAARDFLKEAGVFDFGVIGS
jgi:hypothetical protein